MVEREQIIGIQPAKPVRCLKFTRMAPNRVTFVNLSLMFGCTRGWERG